VAGERRPEVITGELSFLPPLERKTEKRQRIDLEALLNSQNAWEGNPVGWAAGSKSKSKGFGEPCERYLLRLRH